MVKKVLQLLPRVLDVNRFTQARVQEIKQLVDDLDDSGKLGEAAQARNIRRRARSFRGRNHRYRENQKKKKNKKQQLSGLKRKRQDLDDLKAQDSNVEEIEVQDAMEQEEFSNRRMRRRPAKMNQQILDQGKQQDQFEKLQNQPESTHCLKLETHVWHAKRFEMVKRWGYVMSNHLFGAGAGSRSLLQKFNKGAILHDASYWNPISFQVQNQQHWEVAVQILRDYLEESDVLFSELNSYGFSAGRSVWNNNIQNLGQVIYIVTQHNAFHRQILLFAHPACFVQIHSHLKSLMEKGGGVISCFGKMKLIQVLGAKSKQVVEDCLQVGDQTNHDSNSTNSSRYQLTYVEMCDPRMVKTQNGSLYFSDIIAKNSENNTKRLTSFGAIAECGPPLSDNIINNYISQKRNQELGIQNTSDGCLIDDDDDDDDYHLQFPAIILSQLQDNLQRGLTESLILVPCGWERIVWNELSICKDVLGVAGQQELRWIYTNQKKLCFPYDFADFYNSLQQQNLNWNYIGKSIPHLVTLLQQQHHEQQQQKLKKQKKKVQNQSSSVTSQNNPEEIDIEKKQEDEEIIIKDQLSGQIEQQKKQQFELRILVRTFSQVDKIFQNEFTQQWKPVVEKLQYSYDDIHKDKMKPLIKVVGKIKNQQQVQIMSKNNPMNKSSTLDSSKTQNDVQICKNYSFLKFVHVSVSVVGKGCCQEGGLIVCQNIGLAVGFITSASVPGSKNFPGGVGVVSIEWFGEIVENGKFQTKCSLLNKGSDKLRIINIKLLSL